MTTTDDQLPFIHAVTSSAVVKRKDFLGSAERIMRALGPLGAVQLRSSEISGRLFFDLAKELAPLQAETGCWLIVNDRVDIAAGVGAKGVQLASHSLRVKEARAVAQDLEIGISIHSVEEAKEAEEEGAAWVVAGTVFETPSHENRPGSRVPFIVDVAHAVKIPIIAIGGIEPQHIAVLKAAGAYGIATIRGAGWEPQVKRHDTDPTPGKTRLVGGAGAPAGEMITRYISAYDWSSGSSRKDHSDGERLDPGDSAE
ncbi:MAG TPA: thiamine phosphate synthase [Gemmatimonadaceae bacterium]|nr:thiamine phosphate synthase [Gemmatimonadaceae bacterium]